MQTIKQRRARLVGWADPLFREDNKKRLALLQDQWPQAFKEHILPILPVDVLKPHFCGDNGRPTKDLLTMLGLFVLQEMRDLTDAEALHCLSHDNAFRWALDIAQGNDATLYASQKTLYNFRRVIKKNRLDEVIFNETTAALAAEFEVTTSKQRMDSVHFITNTKKLSRLGVMSGSVKKFLKALKAEAPESYNSLDGKLVERYMKEDRSGYDYFGKVRSSERDQVLLTVARDIFDLVTCFESDAKVSALPEFALVARVFREQCQVGVKERTEVALRSNDDIDEASLDLETLEEIRGGDAQIEPGIETPAAGADSDSDSGELVFLGLKPAGEVGIDSLQSPTDPDVGYSGHKGKGYHAQLVETYFDGKTEDGDDYHLNLVTYVKVEPANEQDSAALMPAINDLASRGLAPDILVADTAYGSDANHRYAASMGVDLVSPVGGSGAGRKIVGKPAENLEPNLEAQAESFSSELVNQVETSEDESIEERRGPLSFRYFHSTDDGVITACPMGQKVMRDAGTGNGGRAYLNRETCMRCENRGMCPVTITKNKAWLTYQEVNVRLDKRRAHQDTNDFKRVYRKRSGIEATNSQLARVGLKRLRVRSLSTARFKINLKVLALNVTRVCKKVICSAKKMIDSVLNSSFTPAISQ